MNMSNLGEWQCQWLHIDSSNKTLVLLLHFSFWLAKFTSLPGKPPRSCIYNRHLKKDGTEHLKRKLFQVVCQGSHLASLPFRHLSRFQIPPFFAISDATGWADSLENGLKSLAQIHQLIDFCPCLRSPKTTREAPRPLMFHPSFFFFWGGG